MISQTAEYALRAAVCLAGNTGRACTTRTISEATGVSASYLSKILRELRRSGLVRAHRGPHGGFLLTRPPGEITVLDVVHSVDAPPVLDRCPLHLKAHRGRLCPLHSKLAHTYALMEDAFRESTLRDLVENGTPEDGCTFPAGERTDKEEKR